MRPNFQQWLRQFGLFPEVVADKLGYDGVAALASWMSGDIPVGPIVNKMANGMLDIMYATTYPRPVDAPTRPMMKRIICRDIHRSIRESHRQEYGGDLLEGERLRTLHGTHREPHSIATIRSRRAHCN